MTPQCYYISQRIPITLHFMQNLCDFGIFLVGAPSKQLFLFSRTLHKVRTLIEICMKEYDYCRTIKRGDNPTKFSQYCHFIWTVL